MGDDKVQTDINKKDKSAAVEVHLLPDVCTPLPLATIFIMAKRFTATEKWDDPWYRKLTPRIKAFWQFLCDRCDNAGVWKIDYDLATFYVGENITKDDIPSLNLDKERVRIVDDKLIIIDYIPFQIGKINGKGLTNLQKNCLETLRKHGLTGSVGVAKVIATGIGKGKGKGKGKDSIRGSMRGEGKKFTPPTLEQVQEYIAKNNYPIDAKVFIKYFTESGWVDSKGNKVRNWKQKIITWASRSGKEKSKDGGIDQWLQENE